MLKQLCTYEDYNGDPQTDTLYFNLTKTELVDLMDIQPRLEKWSNLTKTAGKRDLTTDEVRELLDILKTLMEKSYGERSEDGKRFAKSPEIWQNFTQTACYDAFVFSLFENPENAVEFMVNILPKDFAPDAAEVRRQIESASLPAKDESETQPAQAEERKIGDYSREELLEMPKAQFEKLAGKDPSKMSREVLTIAFERKNRQSEE